MALTAPRLTLEEALDLPDDGRFYELLDGELFAVTSPDLDHSDIVGELFDWLRRAYRAGYGRAYTAPTQVLLDPRRARRNAPEPDVFFVRKEHAARLAGRVMEGVPDLLIEVLSPITRDRDLPGGKKWEIYERFAVPSCWVVDPQTRLVAQYAWHAEGYDDPARVLPGGMLHYHGFPELTLAVDALWAQVRQPEQPLHGRDPFPVRGRREGTTNGQTPRNRGV